MKLVLQFDLDADIIDVPECVINTRELQRKRFLTWLYNKKVQHKYWTVLKCAHGRTYSGVMFRGDAFVEWLNKKVLSDCDYPAFVLESHIVDPPDNIPILYF